jgi:hypothetical protein
MFKALYSCSLPNIKKFFDNTTILQFSDLNLVGSQAGLKTY